jgi:hypothetical protein
MANNLFQRAVASGANSVKTKLSAHAFLSGQQLKVGNSIRHMALFVYFSMLSIPIHAQEVNQVDFEKAKSFLQQEREAIFIQALHLSISQATVFHPIYVKFNREKRDLDDQMISLGINYGENYNQLDHKLMRNFIRQSKAYQRKELGVRKKYYRKLGKEISTEIASQFYEVDDFISTSLRLNVLMGLPFTSSITKYLEK